MLETFKRLRLLVGQLELDKGHPAIERAAEFMFGTQTTAGDFRGLLGDQYTTYYTGEITALLTRAGYIGDPRLDLACEWLLAMRQDDGGWTIPILTHRFIRATVNALTSTRSESVEPDRTKPSSHNWTDMALRAFAALPGQRWRPEVLQAARLLKAQLFEPDAYSSYRHPRYWVRFAHWWPNLLTALESLTALGFALDDPDVHRAVAWFLDHQEPDGSWCTDYGPRARSNPRVEARERPWLALRIARMIKQL